MSPARRTRFRGSERAHRRRRARRARLGRGHRQRRHLPVAAAGKPRSVDVALGEMGAAGAAPIDESRLRAEPVVDLMTGFGELKVVPTPAGVPRGYEALRPGASTEHLGDGLRPTIASTGDLIAMSAALRRPEDLERLPALRRILELEPEPARLSPSSHR